MGAERDEELDRLERELRDPFIETPDRIGVQEGAVCWLDARRLCGADCMAFNVEGLGLPKDEPVQGHARCILLATANSQTVELAKLVASARRLVNELEDKKRTAAMPGMPSPFGDKP